MTDKKNYGSGDTFLDEAAEVCIDSAIKPESHHEFLKRW